ncbi:MAG TPA: cytochrome P450 [Thermoleophilaceae bacterium]|nr:cytochrome P450 [Thermoleophilaceae bacterium]
MYKVPYFDLSDEQFSLASDAVMSAREQSWCAETNYGLAVLRYQEVNELLKDKRLIQGSAAWPAHNGVTEGPFVDWWGDSVLNREGDEHARLRRLMSPAFAPLVIRSLLPRFEALAEELVDAFAAERRCEFMSQFATPYAARVTAILLGLPEGEWREIAASASTLGLALGVRIKADLDQVEAALAELFDYADRVIADRRAHPRDDFATRLVEASEDADRLSDRELRDAIVLLIFGGIDTTRNQLGLAMRTFIEHADQWELLAREPELAPKAVDEVMRIAPTVTWITREAAEDFEFQDRRIAKGTTIHLFTQAAATDPRAFAGADFDIAAERARHFGFGRGIHHCLGHFVAKSDMSEALPVLARRLRNPRLDGEPVYLPPSGNTGPVELPVAFDSA